MGTPSDEELTAAWMKANADLYAARQEARTREAEWRAAVRRADDVKNAEAAAWQALCEFREKLRKEGS